MSFRPLVSVVVVNYNYARFLREAVDSALSQSYEKVEVVVVDDGSTDESRQILADYGNRARLVFQSNRGVSAARNRGITESSGELVAFLDSDDVWSQDKLERQVELFRDESVGMVYTGLRYVDAEGRPLGTQLGGSRGRVLLELALLRGSGVPASGSSAVIRRSILERVGPFDEELSTSADWDMWRRIACHASIELVREPLVSYRQHGGAMHTRVDVLERDMLRAFASMFADPTAEAVHPLRKRCYGNLYLTLAGSYLHAGEVTGALRCLGRGLAFRPSGISYVMGAPLRGLARLLA